MLKAKSLYSYYFTFLIFYFYFLHFIFYSILYFILFCDGFSYIIIVIIILQLPHGLQFNRIFSMTEELLVSAGETDMVRSKSINFLLNGEEVNLEIVIESTLEVRSLQNHLLFSCQGSF